MNCYIRTLISFALLFIFSIVLVGCVHSDGVEKLPQFNQSGNDPQQNKEIVKTPAPKLEPIVEEITIAAVGDILIHDRVYNDAKVEKGYDFRPMLTEVKQYLSDETITFANQETMIGGEAHGLSGYPQFNSPTDVGDALKYAGVTIVSIANNHTLDRGEAVIQSAIEHWEKIGMNYVGAYKDSSDQAQVRVIETEEGIAVAFLAYSYGTNGIPVPEGKDYLINVIDKNRIADEIKRAKELADIIVLSLHFGNEYELLPSAEQKELVQFAADQGVHVVLGHHPHVLQPITWVTGEQGNETLVAYSLGNFLSGQVGLERQVGGIFTFTISRETLNGEFVEMSVHSPKFLLTYNASENENNYRVLPFFDVTDEVLPNSQKHYEEMKTHVSQWMPELEFVENKE